MYNAQRKKRWFREPTLPFARHAEATKVLVAPAVFDPEANWEDRSLCINPVLLREPIHTGKLSKSKYQGFAVGLSPSDIFINELILFGTYIVPHILFFMQVSKLWIRKNSSISN